MISITFDTTTKIITVDSSPVGGVLTIDVRSELYSEAKRVWRSSLIHNKFRFPFQPVGGNPIDPTQGTSVPLYAFLRYGWRIRPFEASHTLNVIGGVLLVEGGGDPFVDTLGNYVVRINYQQPVQAITIASGESFAAKNNRILEGDQEYTESQFRIKDKDTKEILVEKDQAGGSLPGGDITLTEPI